MSHNLSSCNAPIARKTLYLVTFDDFGTWAVHQTVFSVACDSDSEILAVLQTVKTVVRTQRHRFDADKFPMLSCG